MTASQTLTMTTAKYTVITFEHNTRKYRAMNQKVTHLEGQKVTLFKS